MALHGHKLTREKAREILRHGEVRGKKLTKKQRGFMGARASGSPVKGQAEAMKRKLRKS